MRFERLVEAGQVDPSRWDMRSIWMRPLLPVSMPPTTARRQLQDAFARELATRAPEPLPRDPSEAAKRFVDDVRTPGKSGTPT